MKYPNLSLAIGVPLQSSCPNHNSSCWSKGRTLDIAQPAAPPVTLGLVQHKSRGWARCRSRWTASSQALETLATGCRVQPGGGRRPRESVLGAQLTSALTFLCDQLPQRYSVWGQQLGDARVVHLGDDNLADLLIDLAEDAVGFHLRGLIEVVLGRGDVNYRVGLEAVDEPEVDQGHQALLAELFGERVLVAHLKDAAAVAILDGIDDDV